MNREVFRLTPPLILWWVWVVFAVANVVDFAIQGVSARFAIVVAAILATVTGLAYTLALRPRVIADQAGLMIVNPFRDHHVPWAAIQVVDTGEWVRVHCAPGRDVDPASGPRSSRAGSSAASNVISCWALYISARTKRRATRVGRAGLAGSAGFARSGGAVSRRGSVGFGRLSLSGMLGTAGQAPGYETSSRLPEEARYLASLPVANAIAVRLDARAARERARARPADAAAGEAVNAAAGGAADAAAGRAGAATARWAWTPAAAVALPALLLIIVAIVL